MFRRAYDDRVNAHWPWWQVALDCTLIYFSAGYIVAALETAAPPHLVHLVFPNLFPGGFEWGAYLFYWLVWTVINGALVLGWMNWKNYSGSQLSMFPHKASITFVALLIMAALTVNYAWGLALNYFFQDALAQDVELLTTAYRPEYIHVMLLGSVVAAPVVEEITFRGILQSALQRTWLGFWGAATVASAAFAFAHFYSWPGTLDIFGVGMILSALLRLTGGILPGIVAHGAINLIYAGFHAANL